METINAFYHTEHITLADRQRIAGQHPEVLLYLITASRFDRTGSLGGKEPLGHLTLASYLQMVGWDVRVFSGNIYDAFALLEANAAQDASRLVITGLYCDYENQNAIAHMARKIKNSLAYPVLIGGPQSVALDEAFSRANPWVDAFIRGDGEYSVSDVLSVYACGAPQLRFSIRGVCGLDGESYVDNGFAEPLMNLDEAPPIRDTSLIGNRRHSALAALSGRGCPFHCAFCYEGGNSKTVRLRSVEHMMHELEVRFQDHPEGKYLYFGDDTFTLMPDRLSAFCDALKELRKKHDFVWYADGHVRVLLAHPEYLPMMIDAGLCRMQIGIESTAQPVIDIYQKNIKKEELYKTVDLCEKAGLPQLIGNIIIGGAMETKETIRETFDTIYDLIRRSRGMLDVTSTLYSNFPGTLMSKDPKRYGLDILDPDGLTSFGDYPIANTPGLNRDEIAALRREFIVESARVMKRCVAEGLVDEERMLTNMYLSRHYDFSSLWVSFGLTRVNRQYYGLKVDFGTEYADSANPEALIPVRTVFFHNAETYVGPIPAIEGFVLSPLEDALLHWSAGKLNVGQIIDKLWPDWIGAFRDRAEFAAFAEKHLQVLERKRLLIFTEYDGSRIFHRLKNKLSEADRKEKAADASGNECELSAMAKDKVILFYPYTANSMTGKDLAGKSQGIYILASVLKEAGYRARVCECVFNQLPDYMRQENDGSIRAVGISVDYENRRLVLQLSRLVTETFGVPVILGGVDARTLTMEEIVESRAVAVIKGEGEITLPKVMAVLDDASALEHISGLLLVRDGTLIDTGAEEPPTDLDAIPFPDYSLSLIPVQGSFFYILTSRGCPNHCAFCHEGTHKTKLRMRSIPNVLTEVRSLLEQYPQLTYIGFCDDTLVTSVERVKALCEGMKELRKTYLVDWYCEADVLSLYRHPEILPMMVDAGLSRMQIGIESGDPDILALYEKKLTPDMVRTVVKAAYDAGLPSMVGPLLVGAPFENRAHVEREVKWVEELIRLAPGMIEVPASIISPYPQTKIGRCPEKYGYTFTDAPGDGSNTDYPAYYTEHMSEKEILAAYQAITRAGAATSVAVVREGLVPFERLKAIVDIATRRELPIWGKILQQGFPFIFSYFQLLLSCSTRPLREVARAELAEWHVQRTFEIWRFVDVSGFAPRIGDYVLSPYEYQLILYCAGKLTIREIAARMQESFGGDAGPEAFLDRVEDTILAFERKYWVVGVPY